MEKSKRKTGGIAKFIEEAKRYRDDPTVLNNIIEAMSEKIDELQAKATAYDRLMSGGKKTLKEWANIFGMPFAIDGGRYGYNCDDVGSKEPLIWIPPRFIDYDGNYGESRTLPDGWEEAK